MPVQMRVHDQRDEEAGHDQIADPEGVVGGLAAHHAVPVLPLHAHDSDHGNQRRDLDHLVEPVEKTMPMIAITVRREDRHLDHLVEPVEKIRCRGGVSSGGSGAPRRARAVLTGAKEIGKLYEKPPRTALCRPQTWTDQATALAHTTPWHTNRR